MMAANPEVAVFSRFRTKWYTNEEVAEILKNYQAHSEWLTNDLKIRPKSGAVLLYSREKVRYRQDGYCWKKRKNGRTTREDHMKLKVQGVEFIYGCYVHSAILPTFHRRCYWLLQNPDIVLVHYLNQPLDDQNKIMITFNPSLLEAETKRTWTNEEIIDEVGAVFGGISEIHHTLNINFPTTTTAEILTPIQDSNDGQQQIQSVQLVEQQHETPDLNGLNDSPFEPDQSQIHSTNFPSQQPEEVLSVFSPSSACFQKKSSSDLSNMTCDGKLINIQEEEEEVDEQANAQQHQKDQQQQSNEKGNLTFAIIEENPQENNTSIKQNSSDLQDLATRLSVFEGPASADDGNQLESIPASRRLESKSNYELSQQNFSRSMSSNDRDLCSPVTQIYNQIVDDIETYALPLGPDQFNSSHFDNNHNHLLLHHHNNSQNHNHHHQAHHHARLSVPSTMPLESIGEQTKIQTRQQSVSGDSLHASNLAEIHTPLSATSSPLSSSMPFLNQGGHEDQIKLETSSVFDVQTSSGMCTMDLGPCDLFNGQVANRSHIEQATAGNSSLPAMVSTPDQMSQQQPVAPSQYDNGGELIQIVDYAPNWCNMTGGAKVLIVGDWASLKGKSPCVESKHLMAQNPLQNSPFSVMFDGLVVPATLIQSNILKCFVPSHEPGFINLEVLHFDTVISRQVPFEIRPSCNQMQTNTEPCEPISTGLTMCNQTDSSFGNCSTDYNANLSRNFELSHKLTQHVYPQTSCSASDISASRQFCTSDTSQTRNENPLVLTLAENIISAMHKMNCSGDARHNQDFANQTPSSSTDQNSSNRLIGHLAARRNLHPDAQRRISSFKATSRSLEPYPSNSSYAINFGLSMDEDPYWHSSVRSNASQPLSVLTDYSYPFHSQQNGERRSSSTNCCYPTNNLYPYNIGQHPISDATSSSGLGSIVSSLSPSTSNLQSPSNLNSIFAPGESVKAEMGDQSPCSCDRRSPITPTSIDFWEYFKASTQAEQSLANLTLNDREQKELYEAAKVIQKAYRTYRGRKRQASELLNESMETGNSTLMCQMPPVQQQIHFNDGTGNNQLNQLSSTDSLHEASRNLDNNQQLQQLNQQYQSQKQQQLSFASHRNSLCPSQSSSSISSGQASQYVLCNRDREMQAATIIQAYYRRYRQYIHYKRQRELQRKDLTVPYQPIDPFGQPMPHHQYQQQQHQLGHQAVTSICPSSANPMQPTEHVKARLVVDTIPMVIDKATSSNVDRKRFKTAALIGANS